MLGRTLVLLGAGAISLVALSCQTELGDLSGKACDTRDRCLPGWTCELATRLCVLAEPSEPSPPESTCEPGLTPCGATGENCVNLAADPENCGDCGVVCESPAHGSAECRDGGCVIRCDTERSECSGRCVRLLDDKQNCGACEVRCQGSESCLAGLCR